MVGISVESGHFRFDQDPEQQKQKKKKLKALIISDFSGRANRNEVDLDGLLRRRLLQVDKDSFEEVFSKLNVRLSTAVSPSEIAFDDIDELHPDHLYENLPIFEHYQRLKRNLRNPKRFDSAVEELRSEGILSGLEDPTEQQTEEPIEVQGLSLDSILSSTAKAPVENDIQSLIRKTVAPYLEPKEHPKTEEYVAAVEAATSDLMRALLQQTDFRSLEASWRGVDLVNRRVDTDRGCDLFILDSNLQELRKDLVENEEQLDASILHEKLIDRMSVAGSRTFDVILFDFQIASSEGLKVFKLFRRLFEAENTVLLAGQPLNVTLSSEEETTPHENASSANEKVFIATPGFMLRLPYGKKTSVVDAFDFEELDGAQGYLWGNSAYLLLINLANSVGREAGRLQYVEDLPMHVYTVNGDTEVTPCAEQFLNAKEVSQLENFGYTVIQAVKNSDKVLIAKWRGNGRALTAR